LGEGKEKRGGGGDSEFLPERPELVFEARSLDRLNIRYGKDQAEYDAKAWRSIEKSAGQSGLELFLIKRTKTYTRDRDYKEKAESGITQSPKLWGEEQRLSAVGKNVRKPPRFVR